MAAKRKRYVCLQAGCDTMIEASDDQELIKAAQAHVAEAHNSFELEEFILAGATEVDDGDAGEADSNEQ
jgi:predicted small metal-binding protein